jgi:hypothetical protein
MVLKQSKDAFEGRYRLKTRGVDLNAISKHVSVLLDMPVEEILFKGLAFRQPPSAIRIAWQGTGKRGRLPSQPSIFLH